MSYKFFEGYKQYRLNRKPKHPISKLKAEIVEIVRDNLEDIIPYIISDIFKYMKRKNIIVRRTDEKDKKKNKKT